MSDSDPGGFLTSSVTSSAGAVAKSSMMGGLGGGLEGAWVGGSVGSLVPGGTLPGAAIGAALGAAFGQLTSTSKALNKVWDNLITTTRSLVQSFAKFDPILLAQQEKWKQLDKQIGKVWAKTLAPTLKKLTDIGIEITQRWTRLKISVFKSYEGVINKLIDALAILVRGTLAIAEFFEKLKNMVMDILKYALAPFIVIIKLLVGGFKELLKMLGLFTPKEKGSFGGGPAWSPGDALGYGKSSAGGMGGTPLLRGKFDPDSTMPGWAKQGKMEFGWWKDLKGWLGEHLTGIRDLLKIIAKIPEAAAQIKAVTKLAAMSASLPMGGAGIMLGMQTLQLIRSWQEQQLGKPVTEEDAARYRKKHNLPKKGEGEPVSQRGGVPYGAAGMVSRTVGLSAFTSITNDPKIRIEEEEFSAERETERAQRIEERDTRRAAKQKRLRKRSGRERPEDAEQEIDEDVTDTAETAIGIGDKPVREPADSAGGNIIMQVLDSNQLLDLLSFSWEEIRTVLRHQQAEYTLLKYRIQTEGTYM